MVLSPPVIRIRTYLARPDMRMSDLSVGAADGVETLLSRKPRSEFALGDAKIPKV